MRALLVRVCESHRHRGHPRDARRYGSRMKPTVDKWNRPGNSFRRQDRPWSPRGSRPGKPRTNAWWDLLHPWIPICGRPTASRREDSPPSAFLRTRGPRSTKLPESIVVPPSTVGMRPWKLPSAAQLSRGSPRLADQSSSAPCCSIACDDLPDALASAKGASAPLQPGAERPDRGRSRRDTGTRATRAHP